MTRRNFEYTRQQWTGKSPKQFLIDWVRRQLPRSPPPSFHKLQSRGNAWRARCRVQRQREPDVDVTPDILCGNVKEAEHLAATLALYKLCAGQVSDTSLPARPCSIMHPYTFLLYVFDAVTQLCFRVYTSCFRHPIVWCGLNGETLKKRRPNSTNRNRTRCGLAT